MISPHAVAMIHSLMNTDGMRDALAEFIDDAKAQFIDTMRGSVRSGKTTDAAMCEGAAMAMEDLLPNLAAIAKTYHPNS